MPAAIDHDPCHSDEMHRAAPAAFDLRHDLSLLTGLAAAWGACTLVAAFAGFELPVTRGAMALVVVRTVAVTVLGRLAAALLEG